MKLKLNLKWGLGGVKGKKVCQNHGIAVEGAANGGDLMGGRINRNKFLGRKKGGGNKGSSKKKSWCKGPSPEDLE